MKKLRGALAFFRNQGINIMADFRIAVTVKLKEGVLDPQGQAVEQGLHALGFHNAYDTRVGKMIWLKLSAHDKHQAQEIASDMARKILANTVIEDFNVEVLAA